MKQKRSKLRLHLKAKNSTDKSKLKRIKDVIQPFCVLCTKGEIFLTGPLYAECGKVIDNPLVTAVGHPYARWVGEGIGQNDR